jgi:hypothetical protein
MEQDQDGASFDCSIVDILVVAGLVIIVIALAIGFVKFLNWLRRPTPIMVGGIQVSNGIPDEAEFAAVLSERCAQACETVGRKGKMVHFLSYQGQMINHCGDKL